MLDRQLLLEQKRQRLQELKQRRLKDGPSEVDLLVDRLQNITKTKVNVAIQTDDEITPGALSATLQPSKGPLVGSVVTFDKAVQTVELWDDNQSVLNPLGLLQLGPIEPRNTTITTNEAIAEIHEPTRQEILQEQQLDGILTVELFLVDATDDASLAALAALADLSFLLSNVYRMTGSRSVVAVDFSSSSNNITGEGSLQEETILVSYSAASNSVRASSSDQESTILHSLGLAILFSGGIPIRFLVANSPLTSVCFDQGIHNRVVGGLQNGKVVVWELKDASHQLILFPLLVSPVLLSSVSRLLAQSGNNSNSNSNSLGSKTHYINHISPITSLQQSSKSLVSSGSLDGVINLWLTSILANPKAQLVQLHQPVNVSLLLVELNLVSTRLRSTSKHKLPITAMLQLERVAGSRSSISNELDYLNGVIIGSQNGNLYKLCNDSERDYISAVGENDPRTIITSIVDFSAQHVLVTTGLEFGFNIWVLAAGLIQKLLKVQSDHLIVRATPRPGKKLQFVTIGYGKTSGHKHNRYAIVQYWDLLINAMKCMCQMEEEIESMPMVARFTPMGDRLFVGFENGELREWLVVDSVLEQVGVARSGGVDNDIRRIMARRKQVDGDRN